MTTPTVHETAITREGSRIMPDDSPHIYSARKQPGIAGQYAVSARVGYPDEPPRDVTFIGSVYGGPVVMVSDGRETFVDDPGRFGKFGEAWVRRFFAAS
jgi:hypothetical protein